MPKTMSWAQFVTIVGIEGIIGYLLTWLIGLNKTDRTDVKNVVKQQIRKRMIGRRE